MNIIRVFLVTIRFLLSEGQKALFGRLTTLEDAVQRLQGVAAVRKPIRTPSDRSILEGLPSKTAEELETWATRLMESRENQDDAVSRAACIMISYPFPPVYYSSLLQLLALSLNVFRFKLELRDLRLVEF